MKSKNKNCEEMKDFFKKNPKAKDAKQQTTQLCITNDTNFIILITTTNQTNLKKKIKHVQKKE